MNETKPFSLSEELRASVQQRVSKIRTPWFEELHRFDRVPSGFLPWECGLSPSALYNCSLKCRKQMGMKTPEVKWMSIRRWVTTTPLGIDLPPGVYFSIKRHEEYSALPMPRFLKTEYVLLMFPYGNVWSQVEPGVPISEEWMWSEAGGKMMLERLMRRDAAFPVTGYFKGVRDLFLAEDAKRKAGRPHMIGIHLKRKRA